MKKLATIVSMFLLVLTFGLSVNITFAQSSDLIDDSQLSGTSFDMELLANSEYQLIIPLVSYGDMGDIVIQEESQALEIMTYDGSFYQNYEDDGYWDFFNDGGGTWNFTTGTSNTTFELDFSGVTNIGDLFDGVNFDIQLLYLSSKAVDEVPPAYTYSSAEIDTPYYDLVTAAEVQSQLTATDPEEGDVTSRISIYNDTYTSASKVVGGSYYIMFVVDDTSGNSAYLQVSINVIDDLKPNFDKSGVNYAHGSSYDLPSWYDDSAAAAQLTLSEVKALFTVEDGYYESGSITYTATCPTSGYETIPGDYVVTLTATDPSGNVATMSVNVTVLSNSAPVIVGSSSQTVEVTNVNITNILALYSATDTEDGSAAVVVDNTNTWDYSNPTLGTYTLILSATDSLGIETLKSITINVVDTTNPVIKVDGIGTGTYSVDVLMSDTTTLQAFIDALTASDSFEGNLTSSIVSPALPSFAAPNSSVMNITCTDSSGNQATLALTVNVVDDIIPVINGATKIVKGITSTLVLSEITSELSATDNIDGIISVELVSDGYTGNSQVLGSYLVQYKATDSAGNIAYHDVRVWVVDNQAPAWVLNDFFVNLGINQQMTRTELVSLLQASGMIGSDISYTVTFVTDEYTGNEAIEGAYSVEMNVIYEDGSEDNITVQLNVPELEDDSDVIVVTPVEDMTGLQKAWNWLKTAATNSWNWIKGIGSTIWNGLSWVWDHILKPVYEFIFVKDTDNPIPVYTTDTTDTTAITTNSITTIDNHLNNTTTYVVTELPVGTTSSPFQNL